MRKITSIFLSISAVSLLCLPVDAAIYTHSSNGDITEQLEPVIAQRGRQRQVRQRRRCRIVRRRVCTYNRYRGRQVCRYVRRQVCNNRR